MVKDSTLTVRTDGGKVIELEEEKSRHIDHGYTVASARYLAADRVILTGEANQLADQQAALTRLSPGIRDFAIYTSDGSNTLQKAPFDEAKHVSLEAPSQETSTSPIEHAPAVELPSYGISL